jgi:hypothetical protein
MESSLDGFSSASFRGANKPVDQKVPIETFEKKPQVARDATFVKPETGSVMPKVEQEAIQQKKDLSFVEPLLNTITPDLMEKDEEFVVPNLNKQFGKLGFMFEQSGFAKDYMTVTAPNGQVKEFKLDPFFGIGSKGTSEELKRWIKGNIAQIPNAKLKSAEASIKEEENKRKEQEQKLREEKIKNRKMLDEAPKESNFFTGVFGAFLNAMDNPAIVGSAALGLGDFIDDFGRSLYTGYKNGAISTPSNKLMINGKSASKEQISKFIKASKEMQGVGPSDEMINFSKIYEDEGGGIWGVIKGLALNPGAIPELIVSSTSAMLNSSSAAAA